MWREDNKIKNWKNELMEIGSINVKKNGYGQRYNK